MQVGKRRGRGGKVLPTGLVKKQKREDEAEEDTVRERRSSLLVPQSIFNHLSLACLGKEGCLVSVHERSEEVQGTAG